MLAGGEGRRMGGRDKGLVDWCGQPLALAVLRRVSPQAGHLVISANRNALAYGELWRQCVPSSPDAPALNALEPMPVFADAPDLPPRSGPLAGMLTAMRRLDSEWIQFVPCDSPRLPADLIARLLAGARASGRTGQPTAALGVRAGASPHLAFAGSAFRAG
jgi:molybdenum cofactor guanylyltransferase